ncbi:isochorismatase family protein, partial [Pseudoflavonifractor sp. BIOML-A3]
MKGFAEHFVDDGKNFEVNDAALVIVDMLNDFCKEGGAMVLPEGLETIEPTQNLIKAFREKKLPIIYINDCHRSGKYDKEFEKR